MSELIFIVAWTGGYEAVQMQAFHLKPDAMDKAEEWLKDAAGEDYIDVYSLNINTLEMIRIESLEGGTEV